MKIYRNIAITDIETIEDFKFCYRYCSVNTGESNHNQGDIDYHKNHNTICFDDGTSVSNFFFWGDEQNLGNCKKYTVKEFRELIRKDSLPKINFGGL